MASNGKHILQGAVPPGETRRIILDNGNWRSVMEIVSMDVIPVGPNPMTFVLSTDPDVAPTTLDVADNRQIGWVSQTLDALGAPVANPEVMLTPGRFVTNDLFLTNLEPVGLVGYTIVLKRKTVSAAAALVTIIKEQAQSL